MRNYKISNTRQRIQKKMMLLKYLSFTLFLNVIVSSCKKGNTPINLSKEQRLDSLMIIPLQIDSKKKYLNIQNLKFNKSYVLVSNAHQNLVQDSLIRFASNQNDIIEIYKNKHLDKIIFLRFSSTNLKLKYGIYIGMSYNHFFELLPYEEPIFNSVTYENEYSILEFVFDSKSKKLKTIKCNYHLD